jgi:hypothetical protein
MWYNQHNYISEMRFTYVDCTAVVQDTCNNQYYGIICMFVLSHKLKHLKLCLKNGTKMSLMMSLSFCKAIIFWKVDYH